MNTPPSAETANASLTRDLLYAARYYLLSRTGIVVLATIAIVAGIALNWSWLVATGIAPILLTILPCAVMCGLGLCMNRLLGGSCSTTQSSESLDAKRQTDELITRLSGSVTVESASACCNKADGDAAPTTTEQNQPLDERKDTHA